MKKYNRRYSKISSLEELRLERSRLELQMEHKEFELRYDWDYMRSLLTVDNIFEEVLDGLGLYSTWEGIQTGWSVIKSLFSGRRKKKNRRRGLADCL